MGDLLPVSARTSTLDERDSSRGDAVIVARLDVAKAELVAASSDFERLRIRDEARAVAAAAAILKRRDVEVEASLLGADAEREIIRHNPPLTAHEGRYVRDNPGCAVARDRRALFALIGSNSNLRAMRRAHANLDDAEFERLKAEHRTQNVPLSRLVLLRRAGDQTTGRRNKPDGGGVAVHAEEQDPAPPGRAAHPEPSGGGVAVRAEEQDPAPPGRAAHPEPAAADVLQVALSAKEHEQLATIGRRHGWSAERAAQQAIRQYIAADRNRAAKAAPRSDSRHPQRTKCRGCGTLDRSKMTMGETYCDDCWEYAHAHGGVFPAPGSRRSIRR